MNITQKVAEAVHAHEDVRGGGFNFFKRAWQKLFSPSTSEPDQLPAPKIGLALSSGGAKSLAHVGVIQVLEENNIPIHAVSGSSMGAYVGALWASGCNGEKLFELAAEMQDRKVLKQLADPAPPFTKGFLKGFKARDHLGLSIGDVSFSELKKKLIVIAADLDSYERIVFREGSVLEAVHASCAMPGVVVPVMVDGKRCTDGGVVEPVPVSSMRKFCDVDLIIAVSTLPDFTQLNCKRESEDEAVQQEISSGLWGRMTKTITNSISLTAEGNTIDTLRRSIRIGQIRIAHDACKHADVVMRAHTHQESRWHDYHNFEHFVEVGRKAAEAQLPLIRELIENHKSGKTNHERKIQKLVG
ncbi:esterase [Oceaniferula spumae]|uniref:Esterase n=1 Tax=Oceaniferula spumae TaxID=2979115 RepID=A0AAT9FI42_9BACT